MTEAGERPVIIINMIKSMGGTLLLLPLLAKGLPRPSVGLPGAGICMHSKGLPSTDSPALPQALGPGEQLQAAEAPIDLSASLHCICGIITNGTDHFY